VKYSPDKNINGSYFTIRDEMVSINCNDIIILPMGVATSLKVGGYIFAIEASRFFCSTPYILQGPPIFCIYFGGGSF